MVNASVIEHSTALYRNNVTGFDVWITRYDKRFHEGCLKF